MKNRFSSLSLGIAGALCVSGIQQANAQRYVDYGPRCGLLRSDVQVKANGYTGTSTYLQKNFKLDPERSSQSYIDLSRSMRLDRQDCENFLITKVRVWAYRINKGTDTDIALALDGMMLRRQHVPHSPSKTPKKILFKVEEDLRRTVRLSRDFNRMMLHFIGDGSIRVDRIEVEWELDPLNFRYAPGFDYVNGPIRDDAPIMIDSQTGNVVVVNGNGNTIVIGNGNRINN